MKDTLLSHLECPACRGWQGLSLVECRASQGEIESGLLRCPACEATYPISRHVPRFVPEENYATNFGLQWNRFRQTQLDSHSGVPISRERFFSQTGWSPEDLAGADVLDVGCGAGRFAEVALDCGANVTALDYSTAVDACWSNLKGHPNFSVIQGDIYSLPFREGSFDYVYCFGVLQHTPDVKRAFKSLPAQLKPGGALAIDLYPMTLGGLLHPRRLLRFLTPRLPPHKLFGLVERYTPSLLALSRVLGKASILGPYLQRLVPVANYEGVYPLSQRQLYEWAVLDTFDWLAPRFDNPQLPGTLHRWFEESCLDGVEILRLGHLTGRGRRPRSAA